MKMLLLFLLFLAAASCAAPWNPNGRSATPSVSYDGNLVVFNSVASNLDFDDANGFQDIFLWDRNQPANSTTRIRRLSDGALGMQSRGLSEYATISDDGTTVYFVTQAVNLVPNAALLQVSAQSRVFKHSLVDSTTSLQSLFPNGTLPREPVFVCGTSWNGRYMLFQTPSRGFIPSDVRRSNPAGSNTIYLKDTLTGSIQLISINKFGNATNNLDAQCADADYVADGRPGRPISADARWVIFESYAGNLDDAQTVLGAQHIYIRDLSPSVNQTFVLTGSRMVVQPGNLDRSFWDGCTLPSLASNATRAAFYCKRYFESVLTYDTIVCDFGNIGDLASNISCNIVSLNSSGLISNYQRSLMERAPSLSANGRFVTWMGNAIDITSDPLYFTPGDVPYQSSRIFRRDLLNGVTTWLGSSKFPGSPNDGGEARPAISGDGNSIVFGSTTTTLLQGVNTTRAEQIYHFNVLSSVVTRPERAPCPYSNESECVKVSYQSSSDIGPSALSFHGEVVAFSLPSPPLQADIQEPPLDASIPAVNDFTKTFMYFNSIPDELVLIVRDDAEDPAPLRYVLGSIVAISDDSRYVYFVSQSPPAGRYSSPNCTGALFKYDSFYRTHQLVSKTATGACAIVSNSVFPSRTFSTMWTANVPLFRNSFFPSAGDGRYISFSTENPVAFSEPNGTVVDRFNQIYTYDAVRDLVILQSTSSGQPMGTSDQECTSGVVSPGGAYASFRCGTSVYFRNVAQARTDPSYQNTMINVNNNGVRWPDVCSPSEISRDGAIVLLTCSRALSDPLSVFPNTSLFTNLVGGIVMLNLSIPLSRYSERVHPIPLPWPQQGATEAKNPLIPQSLPADTLGSKFFIAYNFFFRLNQNLTGIPIRYYPQDGSSEFLAGQANGATFVAGLSERAEFFAFSSFASNLVSYDANSNYDIFHYNAQGNSFTLASASNSYYTTLPPITPCPGVRPHPRFICQGTSWILNPIYARSVIIIRGDIIISDGQTVVLNGTVLANGNVNVGCNSTLIIGSGSSVSSSDQIRICGTVIIQGGSFGPAITGDCAVLSGGSIVIDVGALNSGAANSTIEVLSTSCTLSNGGNITARVSGNHPDPCKSYVARTVVSGPALSVVVTVQDNAAPGCSPAPSNSAVADAGFNLQIALGASLGAVALVAVIAVIVIVSVPKLRHKVFPFLKRRED